MQFAIIGEWLVNGVSPHTGKPVTETCRIVKPEHGWLAVDADGKEYQSVVTRDGQRTIYHVGDTYAIQLGRGKPAIGRAKPLASITRQDVRQMTITDAQLRGFKGSPEYLMVWTKMHDRPAWDYAQCELLARECIRQELFDYWVRVEGAKWFRYLNTRSTDRYDAWVLRFAN